MNRINRRRFVAVTSVAATSAVLVACGNEPAAEDQLNPTQIPDVPGAPPTLAPMTGTPGASASPEDGGQETTGGGGEALTITMHDDFSFDPDQPEVYPGQTITVVNEGFMQHDLVSDDLGIGTELLDPGASQDIVIPEDAAVGESFHFICTVAGHEQSGMVGDFHIVEAGAAAPAEDEGGEEAATDEGAATGGGEALTITMHDDFSFDPDQPEVFPGQTITVVNEGFMQHDLVSDDLGIGTELLNNGESQDIVIPEDAAVGESFHFICTVAGHEQSGMAGDFNIVEGGGTAAAAGETEEEAPAEEEPAEEAAASGGSGEAITITMHDDFSFDPDQPEVFPGQTITVVNEGFMQHDLVSDDLGIGTELLNNGESQDIVIPEDAAVGESFHFICTVAGHEQSGMAGDFNIVEGGGTAAAAGAEETTEEEPADDAAAASGGGEVITITMHDDFSFDPDQPEVFPGQTITVVNEGFMQHDLVSDDLGIGTELLNNGESQDIVIPEDAAVGESFHFICTVAGHEQSGMAGDFNIVEGGGTAAAGAEDAPAEEEAAPEEEATAAGTPDPANNTPMETTVVGTQWEFNPSEFEMAPGGTITFQNDTDMLMGITVEEWGPDGDLRSVATGGTGEITVPEDAEVGTTYELKSNLSEAQNQGMVGTITIVEADGAAATPEAAGNGEAVVVEGADDFSFSPSAVEVSPGQTVTFTNVGFMQHDLVSEDLGIGTELLNNGESEDIVIPDDVAAGETYRFICTVAGHEQSGMLGEFIIV